MIPYREELSWRVSPDFFLHSRVHLLNKNLGWCNFYIKREDELSSGIAGGKYRKFASLIPHFQGKGYDEVLMIGSAQSNNIMAGLQLLNEYGIKAKLMLLQSNENELKGNLLWMELLHDMKNVIWVERENWPSVLDKANNYKTNAAKKGKNVFVLPEGCATVYAIPGALSLSHDIDLNEMETGVNFNHVFIDSGSGISAMGLLVGLAFKNKDIQVHITLIAGTEEEFWKNFDAIYFEDLPDLSPTSEKLNSDRIHFYKPTIAPSFGSITTQVLQEVKNIARNEGILMDPVYSVKHFVTAMQIVEKQQLNGNILFVYNGGSFALSGFQEKLAKLFLD